MPLPALSMWDATRASLHRAAQVIAVAQRATGLRLPNAQHLALFVTPFGLETFPLPDGRRIRLDFAALTAHIDEQTWALADQTPTAVAAQLFNALGLSLDDEARSRLPGDDSAFSAPALGGDYAAVLNTLQTGLARARARWFGVLTPLVVWPHGFDLSGLWFAPGSAGDEHTEAHINLGFSPGSPGFDRPYLYGYAYPGVQPEAAALPAPIRWYAGSWSGLVADYDAVRTAGDPVGMIEEIAAAMFRALSR